ncbi:MAG: hypothetical protein NTZ12_10270 [Candidatus Aminicenantes bacterium]|nr:hypothetical protein [Candidatus Aminicenantes bacterium]
MRWTAVLLVILLVFPTTIFGTATKARGNKATVYCSSGKYRGTLLYVDNQLLVLKEKKSDELLGFAFPRVERVYIRKSKAGIGILAGLGIGIGLVGIIILSIPKKADNLGSALGIVILASAAIAAGLVLTVFTAAGGGLLGSIFGWKRFKLYKMNETEKERAILKLRGYSLLAEFPDELRARVVMTTE